jgi:hypothetical protein
MTTETRNEILKWFIEKVGVPSSILAVIFWFLYAGGAKLHDSVLVPVVDSYTSAAKVAQETLRDVGETQKQQAETLQEISQSQKEIVDAVRRIQPSIQAPRK